jgi:hypothetical protein
MLARIVSFLLAGLLITVVLSTLMAFSSVPDGVVRVEELACYSNGEQLVCFDGPIKQKLACERLDESTVLCNGTQS